MKENTSRDYSFHYQFLDRLRNDCEYYLGNGNRNPKSLWALDEKEHIQEMKKVWNILEVKPDWLSMEQIEKYESEMIQ